ncbi:SprT-like domain-containing protein [Echinicola marina]|uniref:SprT-like domain-containing protein n=1 Tax=Echinicola marina TaxID=2859768 RepID=UPI001CF69E62|nr:SprT-like domain-containing protein [Echinicola marina]UCS94247.1 SprT-like domain-containing protein [Echinicola marina]
MENNTKLEILSIFKKKVPENAVQYCWDLWAEDPFHFYISRSRQTKLGDFRYRTDQKIQKITINHDLNPYQFLITYIHEVAHYRTFKLFGIKIKPHGVEWKRQFQLLLDPLLSDLIFPKDILLPLKRHMLNPKASTGADFWLSKELRKYDQKNTDFNPTYLNEVSIGTIFEIKGRQFKKVQPRRTRILCEEITSGRQFLISGNAEIKIEQNNA